jgi:hypothetical protein
MNETHHSFFTLRFILRVWKHDSGRPLIELGVLAKLLSARKLRTTTLKLCKVMIRSTTVTFPLLMYLSSHESPRL